MGQQALTKANRTLDLILGFGSGATVAGSQGSAPFVGVQYAADQVRFYQDHGMLPVNRSWHPEIKNVVYHGMDWDCPSWTQLLGEKLREFHGNISAELTIRHVNPIVQ